MDVTTLKGEPRTEWGTRTARKLRAAGRLPTIIYGHGEAPESASLSTHDVQVALARGARTLRVELGGATTQYLIKEVQYDYLGDVPIHMDLARVSLDERVKVRVGIELRGLAKGISDGGMLDQHMVELEVECLVAEIPGTLHPSVTDLELSASLLVKDLELPPGVVALADPEERVATVRVLLEQPEAEEAEGEEGAAGAEPERIGRVRKEDGDQKDSKDSKAG